MKPFRLRPHHWILWIACLGLIYPVGFASARPAPQGARNQQSAQELLRNLPSNLNPNEPGLSRTERIRRQQELLTMLRQRNVPQPTPGPRKAAPTPTPRSTPGGRPIPGRPSARGVAPPRVGRPTARTRGGGKATATSQIVLGPDDDSPLHRPMTLYMNPGSVSVNTGEEFVTGVHLLNIYRDRVDRFELVIKYPPEYVDPIAIGYDAIEPHTVTRPNWGIDRVKGEIYFQTYFNRASLAHDIRLLEIGWKALQPVDDLVLKLWTDERESRAYMSFLCVTQNEFGTRGPLTGSIVRIADAEGPVPKPERLVTNPIEDFTPAFLEAARRELAPLGLRIEYARSPIYQAGQWVVFDVVMDNPDRAMLDDLCVELEFNPNTIEFADTDGRNLTRAGVNVLDGPFYAQWGWRMQLANEIDNATGKIHYRVRNPVTIPDSSAVVFRIAGRIKADAADPLLTWAVDAEAKSLHVATGAFLMGEALLAQLNGEAMPGWGAPGAIRNLRPGVVAERADPSLYRTIRK